MTTILTVPGFKQLAEFLERKGLSIAEFHRGLVERYGREKAPRYVAVHTWVTATRRPGLTGRAILKESCDIDPNAWLTEAETNGAKWRLDQAAARETTPAARDARQRL